MSADEQPVPPIVADFVVAPYVDPLPKLCRDLAGVKESTDAVLAAIRHQARNPKRGRSPVLTISSFEPAPEKVKIDCTTAVNAPLDSMATMPFSMKTAKLHSEALTAVAKQLTDALEAEEKERPKAIKRIDEWAADNEDGFDLKNPAHVAALAWFKDNFAFERATDVEDDNGCSEVLVVAVLASTIRFVSFVYVDPGYMVPPERWCKAAFATGPPPSDGEFKGVVDFLDDDSSWNADEETMAALKKEAGEAALARLLPAECPLRDLPPAAVTQLFVTTTLLEEYTYAS